MTKVRAAVDFDSSGHLNIKKNSAPEATHSGGRGEPLHDWFPYLEGFSSAFVQNLVNGYFDNPTKILEPFSGVGTTPITLSQLGISSGYCEINPVLRELIDLKSFTLTLSASEREIVTNRLSDLNRNLTSATSMLQPSKDLIAGFAASFGDVKYFPPNSFDLVCRLKSYERSIEDVTVRSYFRIAVSTCLLKGSLLRRAGDVRYKTKRELEGGIPDLLQLISDKINLMMRDIQLLSTENMFGKLELVRENAKDLVNYSGQKYDGVITSPPYLNGTNYIRNTKLELWYLEYLKSKQDMRFYRTAVITSAINDVSKESGAIIVDEAKGVVEEVESRCYDHRIPKMVAAYFDHMSRVLIGLQHSVKGGSPICIDIGDSVYGGVHVPTHEVLVAIGKRIGLEFEDEVVLRKRHSNKGAPLSQRLLVFRRL
jgi:hypothetical protein